MDVNPKIVGEIPPNHPIFDRVFSMIFTIHFGVFPLLLETPKWLRISPFPVFVVFFPGEISGPTAAVLEGSDFLNCVDWNFLMDQEMDFWQQPAEINWRFPLKNIFMKFHECLSISKPSSVWSNYSDLTRPHPNLWFSKGIPLLSGTSRLVKYHNLAIIRSTHLQAFAMIPTSPWETQGNMTAMQNQAWGGELSAAWITCFSANMFSF